MKHLTNGLVGGLAALFAFVQCGGESSGPQANGQGFQACQGNSECIVRPASCCGSCGAATRGDAIAINKNRQSEYVSTACANGPGCPECYTPQDPTLIATCQAGTCTLVDLLEHPATVCQAASDCRVRTKECCECQGAQDESSLLAIANNQEQSFSVLVCDDQACGKCGPIYPTEATAVCGGGHCKVEWTN